MIGFDEEQIVTQQRESPRASHDPAFGSTNPPFSHA
jgi:hypothetical protein